MICNLTKISKILGDITLIMGNNRAQRVQVANHMQNPSKVDLRLSYRKKSFHMVGELPKK